MITFRVVSLGITAQMHALEAKRHSFPVQLNNITVTNPVQET